MDSLWCSFLLVWALGFHSCLKILTLCASSVRVQSAVPRSGVIVGIPDNGGATARYLGGGGGLV